MKGTLFLTAAFCVVSRVVADVDDEYAPYAVNCPNVGGTGLIRRAVGLSEEESNWIQTREPHQKAALIDWLAKSGLDKFDASSFLESSSIKVGMAFSGGGYRAMLAGAGQMAATDSETTGSLQTGHMGGLLQATTYVTGLSGGSWLVGSVVVNNFTSVQALQNSQDLWNLKHSIILPGGLNILSSAVRWIDILQADLAKKDAGFNTTITDLWGRALSYQFFGFEHGGVDLRYSDVRNYDAFSSGQSYFPIIVADGRAPNTQIISANSTIFEISPFELGSWDPSVYSFTDLRYLGSTVENGQPVGGGCVNGFDNPGFIVGTSSSLFNELFTKLDASNLPEGLKKLITDILDDLGVDNEDIAKYGPNPFSGIPYVTPAIRSSGILDLVDGGEDGQNVPLYPLIQPEREVDVVFAFDNSADTKSGSPLGENWADGASLVKSYERQFSDQGNNTIFPYVPDVNTFVYGGLALQPTFFGCDRNNLTGLFSSSLPESDRYYPPVIVYVANTEHSYQSNTSTFKLQYDTDEVAGLIQNGYNTFTQNNGTLDSEWRSCVACAVILREQQRRGELPTDQCSKCFDKYCWNGQTVTASTGKAQRRDGKSNIVS